MEEKLKKIAAFDAPHPRTERTNSSSSSSSSSYSGGLDFLFIEPPSKDLTCSICLYVHSDPVLTSCCGNHFCFSCVEKVRLDQRPCPLCGTKSFTIMLDKYFVRQINDLGVHCKYKKMGCLWQGSVSELRKHIDPKEGGCECMQLDCPYRCGAVLRLSEVSTHKNSCPNSPYTCKYCEYEATYSTRNKHWSVCTRYPLPCPNNCGQFDIERQNMKKHLLEECLKNDVQCEFAYAGCPMRLKSEDMSKHVATNIREHLNLVARHCMRLSELLPAEFRSQVKKEMKSKDVQIESLESKLKKNEDEMSLLQGKVASLEDELDDVKTDCLNLKSVVFVPPFEFTMTEFRKHKENREQWLSPSFYTHIGGYRMCIGIDARGSEEGQDTHVSVYVNLMKGEYDNHLRWPFKGAVAIELCNQREAGIGNLCESVVFTYDASEIASRVTKGVVAEQGLGIPTFIEHSHLVYNPKKNTEYLKYDCLRFKVVKVDLMNRRGTGIK